MNRRRFLEITAVTGTGIGTGASWLGMPFGTAEIIELEPREEEALMAFREELFKSYLATDGHRQEIAALTSPAQVLKRSAQELTYRSRGGTLVTVRLGKKQACVMVHASAPATA